MKFKIINILLILSLLLLITGSAYASNMTDECDDATIASGDCEIVSNSDDIEVPSSVDVNSSGKVSIPITSNNSVNKDDFSLNCENEEIEEFNVENKVISFDYNLNTTSKNLIINYKDINHTVILNRIYNAGFSVLNDSAEYFAGYFKFKVFDIDSNLPLANKTVKITGKYNNTSLNWINRTSSTSVRYDNYVNLISDSGGVIMLKNYGFYPGEKPPQYIVPPLGQYEFRLTGLNDLRGDKTFNATVKKATVKITIDPFKEYIGTNKDVVIKVVNDETNEAVKGTRIDFYIPNTSAKYYYDTTNESGICVLHVDSLNAGTFKITASMNDTANFNQVKASQNITIMKRPVNIKVSITSPYYYNSGSVATIKVTDKNTGKALSGVRISFKISSYTLYFTTNKKGIINIDSTSIAAGKYKVIIKADDAKYISDEQAKTITVKKATGKISVKKVTAYYKNPSSRVTVKITNTKNKKAIFNAKLFIQIYFNNNRDYHYFYIRTGLDGKIKLPLDNLEPGKHNIFVSRNDNKNYTAKNVKNVIIIKKAPVKFSAKKLTAKKGANKYFKVAVKNTKNKKRLSSGVKVKIKVYTGKSYKVFSKKTDSKGIAKLNVKSLKKGTHKVVIERGTPYIKAKSLKSTIKIK